ncbi:hypothetical protein ACHAPO_012004 [Fusarium lateritium]
MVSELALATLIAVLFFIKLFSIAKNFISPLRSIPGPTFARFSDAWYLWRMRQGHFEQDNQTLHKKYGPVVRYGPNRYSFNDPAAAKVIYSLGGTSFPKSSWYDSWVAPGEVSLFADRHAKRHSNNRKLFQNTYSMTSLISYEPFVDTCADIFTGKLKDLSREDSPIDMGHWFQCYAFDVIGMITYGKRLGFLDQGVDVGGVMKALEDFLSYAAPVGIYSTFHSVLFPLKNFFAGSKGSGRAYVISFTQDRLAEQLARSDTTVEKDSTAAEPFMSKFITSSQEQPDKFTRRHVTMGCVANMVAGSDTTGITLSAILYYLLKTPNSLQRLREEIDAFAHEGRLSEHPTFHETQQMPYLQAIIKEGLRLHPAVGLPLEREVPAGGAKINGHYFPAGTIVGINAWVRHRDESVFGPDADAFKPERWFAEKEKVTVMNQNWMPFGLGSRTCIGRHISMLEISKLIPRIVRDFDITFDEDKVHGRDSWHTSNFWFVKPKGFAVRVTPRA